jgi:hypothetical protein
MDMWMFLTILILNGMVFWLHKRVLRLERGTTPTADDGDKK